jgi:hypothetical protein
LRTKSYGVFFFTECNMYKNVTFLSQCGSNREPKVKVKLSL